MSYMDQHNCHITNKIASVQDVITGLTIRVRNLEDQLDSPRLSIEKRKEVEIELLEIKEVLDSNKQVLSKLHKQNSFMVVTCLVFFCFLVFGVYCMIYGR